MAKAALRAVWRTRVGLDAWDRAQKHLEGKRAADAATEAHVAEVMSSTSSKAPSLCDGSTVQASDDDDVSDAEDHALVSRPTEPPTTIDAFVDGRVVCTAYSHLSEVRCDGAGERSFMHVAVRTTFRFNASVELSSERDIIFVALDEAARENALVEESPVPPSPLSWFTFGAQKKERDFGVVVPADAGPGSKLRVRAPSTGQDMTVTVPAGTAPGALFVVPLPGIPPPSLEE